MKASDLRIGNLVYFETDRGKILLPVETIRKDKISSGFEVSYYDDEKTSYIPLTEEWLLKFGFKINGNTMKINILGINGSFFFEHELGISQISYVHQLQNLYWILTGEELTIKNP